MVIHARQKLGVSERRVCSVTGVSRSTMRYQGVPRDDDGLRLDLIRLAKQYGRYGYRRIAELLRAEGWHLNHKKVERLWREEGLQLPAYAQNIQIIFGRLTSFMTSSAMAGPIKC